jgi:Glycosyltransferase like family
LTSDALRDQMQHSPLASTTVFAFGVCAGPSDKYERIAQPGIIASQEPDSLVLVLRHQPSIFAAYQRIVDEAVAADVEGLVLIHDDVRLNDAEVCDKLRALFAEHEVAIAGVIGSRNTTSAAWGGKPWIGYVIDYFTDDGSRRTLEGTPGAGTHNVDLVDGVFLALSPWALRHLRFDQGRYPPFHGYDADICAQARRANQRVMTIDVTLVHESRADEGSRTAFAQANFIWKSKWRRDQPWWRRLGWALRGQFLPIEFRLRRLDWRD